MDKKEYIGLIRDLICEDQVLLHYYNGHIERFEKTYDTFEKLDVDSVYDFGTGFPFASLYFGLKNKADLTFGCPIPGPQGKPHYLNDRVKYLRMNLCKPPELPQADLVVATECLEHLVCNIYKVRDWLASIAGKYMFLSFPCHGINAKDYDKEIDTNIEKDHQEHIREYTIETAKAMVKIDNFDIVEEWALPTRLYKAPIWHCLLKRRNDVSES